MNTKLDLILRAKRVREQRAAARAAAAAAELVPAQQARAQAADKLDRHQAARPARETEIYRRLLQAPVTARHLRADAALLSGLAAYAAILDAQAEAAATRETTLRQQARRMRQEQAKAARDCEAAQAMCDSLLKTSASASEKQAELDIEDLVRRAVPSP